MPTATDPAAAFVITRRLALRHMGLIAATAVTADHMDGAWAGTPARRAAAAPMLAACWDDTRSGQHRAGWLRVGEQAATLWPHKAFDLPTRGHGLAQMPDGSLLVVARRPGDWLVRLSLSQHPQWVWMQPGRVFSGHVLAVADGPEGPAVLTTEIDTDTGQGCLGVRDASSLETRAEFPTHGLDPHAVLAMPAQGPGEAGMGRSHPMAGMLFVANGGIDTAAETGRTKRHLNRMDPSVVCLHPVTGELLGQWRLPDPRLSLRHLAWAHTPAGQPVLGIALQAEHDDQAIRAAAPVLAVLDWQHNPQGELRLATGQPALAGYGGDVAVVGLGLPARGRSHGAPQEAPYFLVSATRGHALVRYALNGQYLGHTAWADAGALSNGEAVWAGGRMGGMRPGPAATDSDTAARFEHGRLDNHWLSVPVA